MDEVRTCWWSSRIATTTKTTKSELNGEARAESPLQKVRTQNQISVSTNCFVAVKTYAEWDADASAAYICTERSCRSVHSAAAMNADAPAAAQ